jgi:hypothetical protein
MRRLSRSNALSAAQVFPAMQRGVRNVAGATKEIKTPNAFIDRLLPFPAPDPSPLPSC